MFSCYENDHSPGKPRVVVVVSRGPTDLGDLVGPDLRVLFVAINPSTQSARIGYSFSSPGNPFWRLLHESGLTPVRLAPSEERQLLEHGLGLVSTVSRATGAAAELTRAELRDGARLVGGQIERLRPRVVALLGHTLYPVFVPRGRWRGPGLTPDRLGDTELFVLPNPSGRNRAYPGFERKLVWYRALADHLDASARRARPSGMSSDLGRVGHTAARRVVQPR